MERAFLRVVDGCVVIAASAALVVVVIGAVRESRNSPEEAMERCWESILPELESPESAVLNRELSGVARGEVRGRPTVFRVTLIVDERAADGATIRERYRCDMDHDNRTDSWSMRSTPRVLEAPSFPSPIPEIVE